MAELGQRKALNHAKLFIYLLVYLFIFLARKQRARYRLHPLNKGFACGLQQVGR